ncbi:Ca2+-binding RTX toxin-like protein [Rhodobium orientis]|uniref:Calcium-binding protein n=1 Tax=Rhodobium orientis TaxID=34017 RepID=A0A327JQ07_9HYPH|nr:calcium-binding protein [Rhodobium orientis]MBB4301690.1 Ca2+-binding RTX toxin-like protein [Rhodobium orientis]MBK5952384.1 hypothetical protein [Rhodobium orientis]RAI28141.1 hypothetical protein CH339_07270 [Rhodobium orientis]
MTIKVGNLGNNTLNGTSHSDRLFGLFGDDKLFGFGGSDDLFGGPGADRLEGGAGNDDLYGGFGVDMASYRDDPTADGVTVNLSSREAIDGWGGHDDLHSIENVTGSDGDDLITGNSGRNRLLGLRGDDDIRGHGGGDTLAGHRGSDFLSGNKGNDRLDGNNGTDTLFGGNGEDKLSGGAHNDLLNGGTGNDALWGGWGADRFVYDSETGDSDRIRDFQNNIDTIAIDVADGTTIDDVIALASEVGDDVQIDFGDGNVLTIEDAKISHLPNDIVLL